MYIPYLLIELEELGYLCKGCAYQLLGVWSIRQIIGGGVADGRAASESDGSTGSGIADEKITCRSGAACPLDIGRGGRGGGQVSNLWR